MFYFRAVPQMEMGFTLNKVVKHFRMNGMTRPLLHIIKTSNIVIELKIFMAKVTPPKNHKKKFFRNIRLHFKSVKFKFSNS